MDNNILLVYYSFEGNTEYVARKLAETIDIKRTIRLHPLSEPPHEGIKKFAIGGKSALRHEKVGLQQIELNYDEYDTIFIACPVWAATYPPAVGEFLDTYPFKNKKVYFIGGSAGGNAYGMMNKLSRKILGDYSGNSIVASLSLKSPLKNREETDRKIRDFCSW